MSTSPSQPICMVGLGPMGLNLALNLQDHAVKVLGYNRGQERRAAARALGLQAADSLPQTLKFFTGHKRAYWLMVKDSAVDTVIRQVARYLRKGDILIEGGNSHYKLTQRRVDWAQKRGLTFIGTGVSGGEEGARRGPALMPGGTRAAYQTLKPIFTAIAAQAPQDQRPCVSYIGPGGAGHFVKMVHNGIEYGLMGAIGETVWLMQQALKLSPDEVSRIFASWNRPNQPLASYLIEITADMLRQKDPRQPAYLIESVADITRTKGTGLWTVDAANEFLVAVPTIYAAVQTRLISMHKALRLDRRRSPAKPDQSSPAILKQLHDALYATTVIAYAEGLDLLQVASHALNYNLNLSAITLGWRAGCIIRSPLLQTIARALQKTPPPRLLFSPAFAAIVKSAAVSLNAATLLARRHAVPVPVLDAAANYLLQLTSPVLKSASVMALQRDYFGAHGYSRLDHRGRLLVNARRQPRQFHTNWQESARPETETTYST